LDRDSTKYSVKKLQPKTYEIDYEKQYAEFVAKEFNEQQHLQQTVPRDPSIYSLKQLQSEPYKLEFDEQHVLYETNQFHEYHQPAQTLNYYPT
ncbi:unnamed protein product, partial [Rotaria magnacalcarata]